MKNLAIPQIAKMPIEAQATDALREAIIHGVLHQGERIKEVDLSRHMNLSRATLRSALLQIAKEGLVIQIPYTGWQVISMNYRDVWELFTLRSSVERLAARILAETITTSGTAALQKAYAHLHAECLRGNAKKIAAADFALHKTIIDLTEHGRLISQYSLIEQQVRICIRSSDALIFDVNEIIEQHRPIVAAIINHEIDLAGDLSEQHNISEGIKLAEHMRATERHAVNGKV